MLGDPGTARPLSSRETSAIQILVFRQKRELWEARARNVPKESRNLDFW